MISSEQPYLLRLGAAADYLGCSESHLRRLIRQGLLKSVRLGNSGNPPIALRRKDLEALADRQVAG